MSSSKVGESVNPSLVGSSDVVGVVEDQDVDGVAEGCRGFAQVRMMPNSDSEWAAELPCLKANPGRGKSSSTRGA
ncbi:hypothetical protein [Streptomyces sp. NPDC093589]|uniref:hypothetical protein n=1 Tax=Streptomyces sp. NPDC093589 TaxID=3366043 RepID=UPI00380880B2